MKSKNATPGNVDEYIAAFQKHIGFYPAPSCIAHFEKELSAYETANPDYSW